MTRRPRIPRPVIRTPHLGNRNSSPDRKTPALEPEEPVPDQYPSDTDHQLAEAANLLHKARAAGDSAEVERLMGWIDQRLDQRLEAGRH